MAKTPAFYRKKPVTVAALKHDATDEAAWAIVDWVITHGQSASVIPGDSPKSVSIETLEGTMTASPGDYVIRGVAGEFYPCKPDIFEKTYEAA